MRISSLTMQQQSLSSMKNTQSELSQTYSQVSSGKRLINPSDDPVAYGKINTLNEYINTLENYNTNADMAENQLALVETTLNSMLDNLFNINDLTKQAATGTLSNENRSEIAKEMRGNLQELLSLVNTKDSDGQYIFSGHMSNVSPYAYGSHYSYQGDQGQRITQVGNNSFIPVSYSGYDIFEDVMNGNGYFVTNDGAGTNIGNATISNGSLMNSQNYIADSYSIQFVTNSSGDLAYQVFGANQGQVLPPLPATAPASAIPYEAGTAIQFNGIEVSVAGAPAVGDSFGISPSVRQNMFSTVENIITALETPLENSADKATYNNKLDRNSAALNRSIDKILNIITSVGAGRSSAEKEGKINNDLMVKHKTDLSSLQDLDYVDAITKLNGQLTSLQAAQASYAKIQKLSLMDYL